jgi:hypothetical protein
MQLHMLSTHPVWVEVGGVNKNPVIKRIASKKMDVKNKIMKNKSFFKV